MWRPYSFILSITLLPACYAQISVDMDFSKYTVMTNEVFEVTFEFRTPAADSVTLDDFGFSGLNVDHPHEIIDSSFYSAKKLIHGVYTDVIDIGYKLYATEPGEFAIDTLFIELNYHQYIVIPSIIDVTPELVPLNEYSFQTFDWYDGPAILPTKEFLNEGRIAEEEFESLLINGNWHYGGSYDLKKDSIFFHKEETAVFDFVNEDQVILYKYSPLGDEARKMVWGVKKGKLQVQEPAKTPSPTMKIWITDNNVLILERKVEKIKYLIGYYPKVDM